MIIFLKAFHFQSEKKRKCKNIFYLFFRFFLNKKLPYRTKNVPYDSVDYITKI